jgi:glycosyltransferase involved in cell wall biosynthesis
MPLDLARPAAPAGRTAALAEAPPGRPLRVCVLVDLLWSPTAGGHVKFWERAARGAAGVAGLDLTVYFAVRDGADRTRRIADNVRYRLLRPVFSTERLPFLAHVPDHTDLAPYHRRLARELADYDVIHTTDAYFAFARTALRVARRRGIPLVNSVHTDTIGYTRLYTAETVRRRFGNGWLARTLLERLEVDLRAARRKATQLLRHQAASAYVLGPRDQDLERARRALAAERVLRLPRGLELDRFHPERRDRAWLAERFAVAPETPVVLCVGRVNVGKNVMVLAEAMRLLAERGARAVLVCAGEGEDRARIEALLGAQARCPGAVAPDELARLYASADLLAHPSEIETFGNVVTEAMAAGLPVLVAADGQPRRQIEDGETGLAVGPAAKDWADAIAAMLADPARRAAMGRAARRHMERGFADWPTVIRDGLLPVWRHAAAERSRARTHAAAAR